METGPRPLIVRFVSALIPPACREHVLGDLYQRNGSEAQYVVDGCRLVPYVIWSQIRRTARPSLLAGEFVLIYLAFASAAVSVAGFFAHPLAVYQLAIPAVLGLLTLILRDAYTGTRRASPEVAADALLAVMTILIAEQLLVTANTVLALPRVVSIGGAVASLVGLSAIRTLACERGAREMKNTHVPVQSPAGPQKDLHRWWWITAVLGMVVWAFVFGHQAFRQFRPWLIAWLFVFVAIGLYQRRKIYWPQRRNDSVDKREAYRIALMRQRDAQSKWPFRRGPALIFVIAAVVWLMWQEVMNGAVIPRINFTLAIYVFVVTGWMLCGRLLTNRAARDFDRELTVVNSGAMPPDKPSS
jgi:hypothetical protein